ncbi:MAG TPA: DUF349 domain-containing protein [Cytophagaceae bacterium]|jgi:hypothetical protein|nr:DUF349 domain-containing protein [Cytophagaceae bacterium]
MTDKKDVIENELNESLNLMDSVEEHHEEFSSYTKEELVKFLENFNLKENFAKANHFMSQIKMSFDNQVYLEREEALQKFITDGGAEGDFEFKKDLLTQRFEKVYGKIKVEISEHFNNLEKGKQRNLEIKNALLERLRKLIAAEESSLSLEEFKNIQEEWKKTGHVPAPQSQELWNNYKALVDIFYNNRSIFFELKELDRKKNLETKREICEKVEKLTELTSVNQALKELKTLHEEFRVIGPVPKEEQDALWNRLKLASDKIYEKRKEYLHDLKGIQEQNLIAKLALLEKAQTFSTFESGRIDDWRVKTAEMLKLQEEWNKSGAIAQEKAKELSNKFWEICKVYYKRKNDFFKELDKKRDENLLRKVELCEKAEALKDNTNFEIAARELKELQAKWEKVGQVPYKQKDKIFSRFKDACDHFFNKKREQVAEAEKEFYVNLEKKNALVAEIENFVTSTVAKSVEKLKEFQAAWDSIGFVPRDNKKEITDKFNGAISKFIDASTEIGQEAKKNIRLSLEVTSLKTSQEGSEVLKKKEQALQKRVSGIKAEIERYKTNIEFFGRSKGAAQMKLEIQANIDKLEEELKELSQELKILKS